MQTLFQFLIPAALAVAQHGTEGRRESFSYALGAVVSFAALGGLLLALRAGRPIQIVAVSARDRTRNRVKGDEVQVGDIFKWFKEDFNSGYRGINRLEDLLAQHAEHLSDKPEEQAALRAKSLPVSYLEYDWSLNDVGR